MGCGGEGGFARGGPEDGFVRRHRDRCYDGVEDDRGDAAVLLGCGETCGSCAVVDVFAPAGVEGVRQEVRAFLFDNSRALDIFVCSGSFKDASDPVMVVESCVCLVVCS